MEHRRLGESVQRQLEPTVPLEQVVQLELVVGLVPVAQPVPVALQVQVVRARDVPRLAAQGQPNAEGRSAPEQRLVLPGRSADVNPQVLLVLAVQFRIVVPPERKLAYW